MVLVLLRRALLVQYDEIWCLAALMHVLHLDGACVATREPCLFSILQYRVLRSHSCSVSCWGLCNSLGDVLVHVYGAVLLLHVLCIWLVDM